MKKSFIRIVQCNASGNHCLIDTLDVTPFARLHDYMEYFVSAFLIHKNYPSLRYFAPKTTKLDKAIGHLENYAAYLSIPFNKKDVNESFLVRVFEQLADNNNFLYFAHGNGFFTHSKLLKTVKGNEKIWSSDHALKASLILENIVVQCGYNYNEISLLRHPVDILLSRIERYRLDDNSVDEHSAEIREAFEIIRKKAQTEMTPIIKYEEIVNQKGACLKPYLPFSEKELKNIDTEIFYSKASINKRFKYSISRNKFLLNKLGIKMDWTGYNDTNDCTFIHHYVFAIKQYIVSTVNDIKLTWIVIFCGYTKVGQTYHHKLTYPARIAQRGFSIIASSREKLFKSWGQSL